MLDTEFGRLPFGNMVTMGPTSDHAGVHRKECMGGCLRKPFFRQGLLGFRLLQVEPARMAR